MKSKRIKEWNIEYVTHDGNGGLNEFFIVLPSIWMVAAWVVLKGRIACQIYIWTSSRIR